MGEPAWKGFVKAGEKFQKKYIVKFPETKIAKVFINVFNFSPKEGITKRIVFHVGGAIEENNKVKQLKGYINTLRNILQARKENKSLALIDNQKASNLKPPEILENELSNSKAKYRIAVDEKTREKNDSLEIALKAEYKKLYGQYISTIRQDKIKNKKKPILNK